MVYEQNVYDITENTQINSNLLKPTHSDSKRFKENHKFSHITFVVKDFKRILNLVFQNITFLQGQKQSKGYDKNQKALITFKKVKLISL